MSIQLIYKLQIITLLDSICFGLTYPFLSTYIQSLGADHVVVGILAVGYLLCSLISKDLICIMKIHERQNSMVVLLLITMMTYLSLIITNNYWFIIFGRCVYSIVANQSQNICRDLIIQNADTSKIGNLLTSFSILSGSGYIIGPIIAGYLFNEGFFYIGLLAASLTFVNICLAMTISDNSNASKGDSSGGALSEKICRNLNDIVTDFRNSHCEINWDIMAIKFLHASCIMIFYGKFSQILKYNYQSSSITVGNTYAYMNSLTFASVYFVAIVKNQYAPFSPVILAEASFKFLCACLLIACYSPIYFIYMIMCIPIIFLSTFIDSIWEDFFATRGEYSLGRLNNPLRIGAGLTTPVMFGVLCNAIGHHAVIIFSVIPTIVSTYIINKYTKCYNVFETDKKNE